ncbi:DUF547 domain-containing protein [Aquimarina sp. ERC-38]|uniref:DUF547 domain-containing protein n=1 Tax=Aquimarina sp. ERC-38 TaxID=2949996 RepID=UPI002245AC52|nr:DUF547 domain-containing protein [Aquimarina sp. ERC-38]UZO81471.1 DUF547 domain-containing protein [Aquimarina sp. ERC-38]
MKTLITYFLVIFGLQLSLGQTTSFFKQSDAFFAKYVKNGKVDYSAIKNNPEELDAILKIAATTDLSNADDATFKAFHINAYNLYVIKGVLQKYPVKSPLDIKGFFEKKTYTVAGKDMTLNALENKVLRKKYPNEPRFHFALVCGGLGCPPIISEAYTPEKLEAQLQRQTEIALNNPSFIKVNGKKAQISQIFEWYKGDFTKNGNEIDFINKYREEKIPAGNRVSYYSYDWTLNDTK